MRRPHPHEEEPLLHTIRGSPRSNEVLAQPKMNLETILKKQFSTSNVAAQFHANVLLNLTRTGRLTESHCYYQDYFFYHKVLRSLKYRTFNSANIPRILLGCVPVPWLK